MHPRAYTLSNAISLVRLPLALLFLINSPMLRCLAIVGAMASDCLDGFLARRYRQTSQFGAVLDPLMDKFFVVFALGIFVAESRLTLVEMSSLLCRDFAIIVFGIYLYLTGKWARYRFGAIWWGKVTTVFQFVVLIAMSFGYAVPYIVFILFFALGVLALIELYLISSTSRCSSSH